MYLWWRDRNLIHWFDYVAKSPTRYCRSLIISLLAQFCNQGDAPVTPKIFPVQTMSHAEQELCLRTCHILYAYIRDNLKHISCTTAKLESPSWSIVAFICVAKFVASSALHSRSKYITMPH